MSKDEIEEIEILMQDLPNNSRNPTVFGPPAWEFLHNISYNYPQKPDEEYKKACKSFLMSLPRLLPCLQCGIHYEKYMLSQDLDKVASNRQEFFKFFYDLHNKVNLRTGKPFFPLDKALKMACGEECGNSKNESSNFMYILIILILACITIYLLVQNSR